MAGKSGSKDSKADMSTSVRAYLLLYNSLQVVGWSYLLFQTVNHLLSGKNLNGMWPEVRLTVIIFQNAAVLEIINVAVGFVRSNLGVTFAQVLSRVVVCGALAATPTAPLSSGLPLLLLAWSVTEVIRYSYYALNLLGGVPYFILWCRYTFFYFLYPIGITGELLCLYAAQSYIGQKSHWSIELPNSVNFTFSCQYLILIIMASYAPLFPQLYLYMIGQRKKIIVNPTKKSD